MESKIDLHVHTYYSDGTLSPTEIIKWAKKSKLDQVAITDHDGVEGIQEALIAGEALDILVIPGIEFSVDESNGIGMHILGYHIDINNKELKNKLEYIKQKRKERNDKLITVLSDLGYPLVYEDMKKRGKVEYTGKPDFARGLINKGYIAKFSEAFEMGQFLMSEKVRKIKKEKISAKEAIELISGAGGIAVLAHPMKVTGLSGEYFKALEDLVIKLKVYGLKGMECFYPEHSEEEAMNLVNMAEKYKLHMTKGSDYHGPKE
ncbi:MAG: PHP domain-containing protein [Peptostreptococcaceae bacterium]|nr:PHP domain-containing protein [Peptostreptococcaceae bacterium]